MKNYRLANPDMWSPREHLRGKYHCTVDLLFDRFRNVLLCITKFSAPSTNWGDVKNRPFHQLDKNILFAKTMRA